MRHTWQWQWQWQCHCLDLVAHWAASARADGRREPMITISSLRAEITPAPRRGQGRLGQRGGVPGLPARPHPKATVFFTFDLLAKIEESQHSAVFPAPSC